MYIPKKHPTPKKSFTHCNFLLASIITICKDELLKHKTERENKMEKVQIENLDNFLDVNDLHIFSDGPRKKGYFIYVTKEDYRDKVKPAGVEVLMIELV